MQTCYDFVDKSRVRTSASDRDGADQRQGADPHQGEDQPAGDKRDQRQGADPQQGADQPAGGKRGRTKRGGDDRIKPSPKGVRKGGKAAKAAAQAKAHAKHGRHDKAGEVLAALGAAAHEGEGATAADTKPTGTPGVKLLGKMRMDTPAKDARHQEQLRQQEAEQEDQLALKLQQEKREQQQQQKKKRDEQKLHKFQQEAEQKLQQQQQKKKELQQGLTSAADSLAAALACPGGSPLVPGDSPVLPGDSLRLDGDAAFAADRPSGAISTNSFDFGMGKGWGQEELQAGSTEPLEQRQPGLLQSPAFVLPPLPFGAGIAAPKKLPGSWAPLVPAAGKQPPARQLPVDRPSVTSGTSLGSEGGLSEGLGLMPLPQAKAGRRKQQAPAADVYGDADEDDGLMSGAQQQMMGLLANLLCSQDNDEDESDVSAMQQLLAQVLMKRREAVRRQEAHIMQELRAEVQGLYARAEAQVQREAADASKAAAVALAPLQAALETKVRPIGESGPNCTACFAGWSQRTEWHTSTRQHGQRGCGGERCLLAL